MSIKEKKQHLINEISRQSFQQTWDQAIFALDHICSELPGNEIIDYLLQIGSKIACYFIIHCMDIVKMDDSGLTTDQLANIFTKSIHEFLETKQVNKISKIDSNIDTKLSPKNITGKY